MFYYSETKYLHEVKDGVITGGIKGFAKITFREQRGTVSLHIDAKEEVQSGELEMLLYEASENEALHRIAEKKGDIKKESVQFTVNLEQPPFSGEECWFGCLVHAGNKWYGEEGEYLKEMFEKIPDKEQTVLPPEDDMEEKPVEQEPVEENQKKQEKQEETEAPKTTERLEKGKLISDIEMKEREITSQSVPDNEERTFWKSAYLTDLTKLGEKNSEWGRYGQNSFLLHGFYNYKHLIATEKLLGVPGNYYDKERQVAAMFGFHGFLPVKELEQFLSGEMVYTDRQITPGTFGYYFEEERNLDSLDAPQGNRGKVRYTNRGKGF